MSACVLELNLSPSEGQVGTLVRLRAHASTPAGIAGVRVAIVGYGWEESLAPAGADWVAETTVPYEAMAGEYALDVFAVDAEGRRVATTRATFRVTE